MQCNRCGKEMTDENGFSLTGFSLVIRWEADSDSNKAFYEKQMGKYELDREYNFCFECWLGSLMGK